MRARRIIIGLVVLIGLALAIAGCTSSSQQPFGGQAGSSGTTVALKDLAFVPDQLRVKAGDTVTFDNQDTVPHAIKIGEDTLGQQGPGEMRTWKAPADGEYDMTCLLHANMQGKIVVGDGSGSGGKGAAGTEGGSESTGTGGTGSGGTGSGGTGGGAPGY